MHNGKACQCGEGLVHGRDDRAVFTVQVAIAADLFSERSACYGEAVSEDMIAQLPEDLGHPAGLIEVFPVEFRGSRRDSCVPGQRP